MKAIIRLVLWCLVLFPACACLAGERWYWATAQCSDEADETVYEFVALADIATDEDAGGDEPQQSEDAARFGFGNYAEDMYAEEYCGSAEITAQNMDASRSYDSREEAAAALDDYVAREEAKAHPWLKFVRVDDYVRDTQ
jgi:hypothetical protein